MANKKINQLVSKTAILSTDIFGIGDATTGQLFKKTIAELQAAIGGAVISVNGLVGTVVLDTDDIQELATPTNKYFTDARARGAISLTVTGNSGASTYSSGTGVLNVPTYTLAGLGGISATFLSGTSGISYNSATGVISYSGTVYTDASIRALFSGGTGITYNSSTGAISYSGTVYTDASVRALISMTTTGTSGASTYNNTTGVINVPNYTLAGLGGISLTSLSGGTGITYNNTTGAISYSGTVYTDASVRALFSGSGSVSYNSSTGVISSSITQYTDALARASISLTTTGTSGASTYNSTTGVLNVPQYQAVLTNPVTGTGTTNYHAKWISSSAIGNSLIYDDGTNVGIGLTNPLVKLEVLSSTTNSSIKTGSLEIQGYAVNNCWFGDNIYWNGSNFVRRAVGYTGQFLFFTGEGQFRFGNSSTAGSVVNNGTGFGLVPFKMNIDGTVGIGGSMSGDPNNYTGAKLIVNSSGNTGINTLTIGSQIQVNGNAAIGYSASTAAPANGLTISGNTLIGTTTDSGFKLDVNGTARVQTQFTVGTYMGNGGTISSAVGFYGAYSSSNNNVDQFLSQYTLQSTNVSNVASFRSNISTPASSFTLTTLYHFGAGFGTLGAGSAITNHYGYWATSSLSNANATNTYGFFGDIATGTGRWNLYMGGTANNYLAGNTLIGTTTNHGSTKLAVQGGSTFGDFSLGGVAAGSVANTIVNIISPTQAGGATVGTEAVLRLVRAGTSGAKYNQAVDFNIGTYAAALNSNTQLDIRLTNGGTNTPDTTVMSLFSTGNVAIGTTDVAVGSNLIVAQNAVNILTIRCTNVSNTSAGRLFFQTINASSTSVNSAFIEAGLENHAINSYLAFASNTTERMRISSDGKVGINTSTPGAKLEVKGNSTDGWIKLSTTSGNPYISSTNELGFYTANTVTSLYLFGSGNVGINNTTDNGYKLYVAGTIYATGNITANSDLTLKKNLTIIDNPTDKLMQLNGYAYQWKEDDSHQYGVIAQEVEKILPYAVSTGNDGIKGVSYNQIIPVLIEAVKEQKKELEELRDILASK
jgi:predicted nuclease of predicted toxin-antitoxin system